MAAAAPVSTPAPAPAPSPARAPLQAPAARPLPPGYTLHPGYPPVAAYLHLRAASGLAPKTPAQAAPVAAGSWYGCYVTFTPPNSDSDSDSNPSNGPERETEAGAAEIVAMGRIIGDGAWYFLIADMAVLPGHQRRGLGAAVLCRLLRHLRANAPCEGGGVYVTLFADEAGRALYRRCGFADPMPLHLGMMMPVGWEERWA
ncbi:hypothetical protein BT67DRAFT_463006 [Trichocladium antarcticum]|uniref:N-acetyltransferase domain-containing protein n=1 Tax=Trichocladium antarcticum TaxID=1450529 RepID=A0AAN6UIR4_9PEZI|nr:hypothetical protein BT67DRAFT_463006 [Trichocladium antarcticum]